MKKNSIIIALLTVLLTTIVQAESIWHKDIALRYSYTKYATFLAETINVEFGVWPIAYGHTAGVVYTDDNWGNAYVSEAEWVANIPGEYDNWDELWSVWISAGGENGNYMGQPFTPFTIEYALYVIDLYGNVYWDNNNGYNHRIYVY